MGQQIKIRKAGLTDIETIYKFISHLEERSFEFDSFKEKFKVNIGIPDILYLVAADQNDEVIGFISGHGQNPLRLDGWVFEIQEMYVTKSYRGKGIEQMLFMNLEEQAVKLDCERMEVSADATRPDAKKFYSKLGFSSIMTRYIKTF
jgi:ribosomal protein S18 acetylase RimI-like enzyme